ncbi:hypothetical protein E4T56_gene8963 [Termitomyces sp. T112]|nr:hypothetical protein E4T56_gene8963 [Termitomyces sp. T112]
MSNRLPSQASSSPWPTQSNRTRSRSTATAKFPKPIDSSNNGFDFHIYYMHNVPSEMKYARELHERIRREFPELRIYKFWEKPIGPHPSAMFEVNTFTPHQTGAFFSWLTVHRGPCSLISFLPSHSAHHLFPIRCLYLPLLYRGNRSSNY